MFALPLGMYAQTNIKSLSVDVFYGVDFSNTKVCGADETDEQFRKAFGGINGLFISESKKYDVSKAFKKEFRTLDLDVAIMRSADAKLERSKPNEVCEMTDDQVNDILSAYGAPGEDGVGVLIIAELLSKKDLTASYNVVFFDIATKNVLYFNRVSGSPGGFGLRNFWAGSVKDMLRCWKY